MYGDGKDAELSDALLRMIKVASRNHTVIEGTIDSVDEEAYTCEVTVGDDISSVTFSDIPLETVINSRASVTFIPEDGSNCLLCFRDGNQDRPQLLKTDKVKDIYFNPSGITQYGDGSNKGVPLVIPLVEHMNNPENDLNNLKNLIAEWVPVMGDGGASLKTLLSDWFASLIPITQVDDIQNMKVIQ